MEKELHYVKQGESYHTGGGLWVDILTLNDGTALVVSDEGIGLYWSKDHFHDQNLPEGVSKLIPHGEEGGIREYMGRLGCDNTNHELHTLETAELKIRTDEINRLMEITRLLKDQGFDATYEPQMGGGCQGVSIRHGRFDWLYTDGHTEPALGKYPLPILIPDEKGWTCPLCHHTFACYVSNPPEGGVCEMCQEEAEPPGTAKVPEDVILPVCQRWTVDPKELVRDIVKHLNTPPPKTDAATVDAIRELMSGKEWGPETLDEVADLVRSTGRMVKDYPPDPRRI